METKTVVNKLDWNDVHKLLYAVIAHSNFQLEFDKDFYDNIRVGNIKGNNRTVDDKATDTLMNGGAIYIYDENSGGRPFRKGAEIIKEEYCDKPYVQYTLTLKDFVEGFENLLNRKYVCSASEKDIVNESVRNFIDGNPKANDLYPVLQIVMFNQIIYPL